MPRARPVAGYRSQTEAIDAFLAQGLDPEEIEARHGIPRQRVWSRQSVLLRRPAPANAVPATAPSKEEKLRRIWPAVVRTVADGLGVSETWLKGFIASELAPQRALPAPAPAMPAAASAELTRGEARRLAEAREAEEMAALEARAAEREQEQLDRQVALQKAFGLTPTEARYLDCLMDGRVKTELALFAAGGHDEDVDNDIVKVIVTNLRKKLAERDVFGIETIWGTGYQMAADQAARVERMLAGEDQEPSRADDEAELAALAEEEAGERAEGADIKDGDDAPPLYRLQHKSGAWVHRDLSRTTWKIGEAWQGTAADMERVFRGAPAFADEDVYLPKRAA